MDGGTTLWRERCCGCPSTGHVQNYTISRPRWPQPVAALPLSSVECFQKVVCFPRLHHHEVVSFSKSFTLGGNSKKLCLPGLQWPSRCKQPQKTMRVTVYHFEMVVVGPLQVPRHAKCFQRKNTNGSDLVRRKKNLIACLKIPQFLSSIFCPQSGVFCRIVLIDSVLQIRALASFSSL